MAMTKKDYELVAKALANQRGSIVMRTDVKMGVLDETIENMAAHFALMNDKFNKETFMGAAEHGQGS